MMKNVLVTGGFGFIGSDFIKLIFEEFTLKKIEFKIYYVDEKYLNPLSGFYEIKKFISFDKENLLFPEHIIYINNY